MRLIFILLFVSSTCLGQYIRDKDTAYIQSGTKYLVGTSTVIPNPPDPPDPPDPIIPGTFEGRVLYDIDFSEQGTAPFVNSDATARSFFPGVAADHFWRWAPVGFLIAHPEVDSIVILDGDECWRITMLGPGDGASSKYGVGWIVYMEQASFNNWQVDFDVYMSADWDMMDDSQGGKFPGGGASHQDGSAPPTGGDFDDSDNEGYSNRVAFGNGYEIGTTNYIHEIRPGTTPRNWFPNNKNGNGPFVYNTLTWYHITMRIKQNTVGTWDGTIEFFVDKVSRMLATGVKIRSISGTNFDYVMAEIFAGGNPTVDWDGMSAWIDNLVYSVPDDNGTIGVGNTLGDENSPQTYSRIE